jgi:hypothetical protein
MNSIVACVTFGHPEADVAAALAGARDAANENAQIQLYWVDDASGYQPKVIPKGVRYVPLPARRGYAGVLSHIVSELCNSGDRLLLINPDASIDPVGVRKLLETDSPLAIPQIARDGWIDNVRTVATAREQLLALAAGEWLVRDHERLLPFNPAGEIVRLACPPHAPSGAVLSIEVDLARHTPFRSKFFWLEMSDWLLRIAQVHPVPIQLAVLPVEALHVGASTSLRYPISVAASQARAKVCFIREYGKPVDRIVWPLALLMRALRFGASQKSIRAACLVFVAGCGLRDWRIQE